MSHPNELTYLNPNPYCNGNLMSHPNGSLGKNIIVRIDPPNCNGNGTLRGNVTSELITGGHAVMVSGGTYPPDMLRMM